MTDNDRALPGLVTGDWIALCLITEDNEPHAWPYLAEVIRNRLQSSRYPGTYREIVLQDKQFSRFNALSDDLRYRGTMPDIIAALKIDMQQFGHARAVVAELFASPTPLFSRRVLFFYAPGAMTNKAKKPSWWDADVKNTIVIPQLTRWVFGEAAR